MQHAKFEHDPTSSRNRPQSAVEYIVRRQWHADGTTHQPMKSTTLILVFLALNLLAADSPTDHPKANQQTVLVRLNYDKRPDADEFILGNILTSLSKNGFSVALDRRVLEQEVRWLEGEAQPSERSKQVLDYLRAALAQDTLQPRLTSPPKPPPSEPWRRDYTMFGYYPWNWIFLGDISNRVALASTNVTPAGRILDFNVRLFDSPTYSLTGGIAAGMKVSKTAPDVTLATFIGEDRIRTSRIQPEFKSSYGSAHEIRAGATFKIEDFLTKNVTDSWFKKDASK